MERLKEQMEFLLEIDKLKQITRQTYISDGTRKEDDAEHAWHFAMMAMILKEHANEPVDVLKVIQMALVHDIVEIDAGDTYLYDEEGNRTKAAREEAAAKRIFYLLPKDQADAMYQLWREFDERETPEARFAATIDRLQPIMLNDATHGKAWSEHGVCEEQVMGQNIHTHLGSETLWNHILDVFEDNMNKGYIKRSKDI